MHHHVFGWININNKSIHYSTFFAKFYRYLQQNEFWIHTRFSIANNVPNNKLQFILSLPFNSWQIIIFEVLLSKQKHYLFSIYYKSGGVFCLILYILSFRHSMHDVYYQHDSRKSKYHKSKLVI